MQTTETLKRQIQTAEDLCSVVRTMKTLAAVNIRQYEGAVDSLADYQRTIEMSVRMLLWNASESQPRAARAVPDAWGAIAFGSDQGMCGPFNEALSADVLRWLDEVRTDSDCKQVPLLAVGSRLADRLVDAGEAVDQVFELPGSVTGITPMIQELLPEFERWQRERGLNAVMLFHNRRLSQTAYEQVRRPLLPITPEQFVPRVPESWPTRTLPLLTLPREKLWGAIVRQHLFVSLFQACAESQASENAARITAMQAAEQHITERLGELRLNFQQLRQTSITEELLDIVTGFEALMSGEE